MLDGGGAAVEAAVPVAKVPVQEIKAPKTIGKPVQEASEQNGPEAPKDLSGAAKENILTAENVQELTSILEQSEDNKTIPDQEGDQKKVDPEGYEANYLRAITSKGDMVKNLELEGQAIIDKAQGASAEGGKALTDEQKIEVASGYDAKIGALQIKLNRTKNSKERQILSSEIKTLQQEKKDKTGIEKNHVDDLAKLYAIDGKDGNYTKYVNDHIEKGTPILAVIEISKIAVVDKDVRVKVLSNFKKAGYSEDQVNALEKNFKYQEKMQKIKKGSKMVGLGSLIGMILMMYSGLKKEKQGMG